MHLVFQTADYDVETDEWAAWDRLSHPTAASAILKLFRYFLLVISICSSSPHT
jgi:hypothetical protein